MKTWNGSFDLDTQTWDRPPPVATEAETLVFVFGSPEHPALASSVDTLVKAFPRSTVVGCSSAGEISGTQVSDNSLAAAVVEFEHTAVRQARVRVEEASQSASAGAELGRALAGPGLRAVFILSDGLVVNGSELVRGLNGALPSDVVVTGGLSGDGTRFEKTWVLSDGALRSHVVVAVGLYGAHLRIGHGSKGGWDEFGPERTVTRSTANVLYELDGKPALDLYKQYLGDKAAELPSSGLLFPLALRDPADREKVLVRTLLAVDEAEKSMTFAGDLPTGHTVQLMKADFDRLVDGASQAATIAGVDHGKDCLVLAVSCVGRRLVLGERLEEELEAIRDVVDTDHIVGFYSYGELSPFGQGSCDLHNQTMTLTVMSEADEALLPEGTRGGMELARVWLDVKRGTWDARMPAHLDGPRTLVTVFADATIPTDSEHLRKIQRAFPQSHIVGCSGAGEIHGSAVRDGSISVAVSRFTHTRLRQETVEVSDAGDSFEIGRSLAEGLKGADLKAIFVLSDGLNVNGSELVRGINDRVGPRVAVTGGLAGDGTRFEKTWVITGQAVGSNLVSAVGFYGDHVLVHHGSMGGWDAFGPLRTITRSENNVLFELDGKPALALYKQYLGDKAAELPSSGLLFPLALTDPEAPEKVLVRTLLGVDEEAQSMTFAGDLPEGHRVQLMKANFERLVEGARGAAVSAVFDPDLLDGSASLAIAISCVGRRLVLGERIEEEIEAVHQALPFVDHVTGFYSYGELSPSVVSPTCDLHNQTMTLTTIAESVAPVIEEMVVQRATLGLEDGQWSPRLATHLDDPQTLVLVFGSPEVLEDPSAATSIASRFPRSVVVGCSTAGEIHGTQVRDQSLSVAVTRFAHTRLQVASTPVTAASASYGAGQKLARELAGEGLRAVFVLSEGLGVNGSELVRGLNATLGADVLVTGGLAGDGTRFEKTWVLCGDELTGGSIVAVGLYGDHLDVRHGSMGGWDHFGPVRTITRSEGNELYELDGKPALALYKQYLGDKAAELPSSGLLFPLALRQEGEDKVLVRTLLAVDEEANSMTFAGDLPQGHTVQLMKADFDRLVDGAADAAKLSRSPLHSPGLTVAISCVGRRLVLGDRIEEEVEAIRRHLGDRTEIVGFYSYGELSPSVGSPTCDLHNQTMTLTTFVESPTPIVRTKASKGMEVEAAVHHRGRWSKPLPTSMDSVNTLVLAFGPTSVLEDPAALDELSRAFPLAQILGCSTAGEIDETTVSDDVVSVSVAKFNHTPLRSASVHVSDATHSFDQGRALARQLAQDDLYAIFVLSDGLMVNGSELIRGINDAVGEQVIVTGGLAGDGTRFEKTWVADRNGAQSGKVSAVGFYGRRVVVRHGSLGGWDAFGPEREVTRSEANVVFEIDGKPALDLYETYLGDKAAELPASGLLFPLAMRTKLAPNTTLVRTLLAIDKTERSLTFAGDLPVGASVQLMKANFERLIQGAREAAESARLDDTLGTEGSHSLAVAVSCVGRRLVLGDRIEEETEAIRKMLPGVERIAGFYSYGELSPTVPHASCDLHNQTMTLTVFAESEHDRIDEGVTSVLSRADKQLPRVSNPVDAMEEEAFGFDFGFEAFDETEVPEIPDVQEAFVRAPTPVPVVSTTAEPHAVPRRSTVKRAHQPRATLTCDVRRAGSFHVVSLAGRLSEAFKGAELGRRLVGNTVLDLHGLDRITSFGVRAWLEMLREMDAEELYFVRCSEAVVNQLTMIRNFCGHGRVVSFFAPYTCASCGMEYSALYDAIEDRAAIDAHDPFMVPCPSCEGEGSFDDDPWSYFAMNAELVTSHSEALEQVLSRLVPMGDASDPIQKEVDGGKTVITLNTRIDETLRLRRVLDGLEGKVVFDMTGVKGTSPAGVRGFATALRRLHGSVTAVVVVGCPESLLDVLMRDALPQRVTVDSVMATAVCPDTGSSRPIFVDLKEHEEDLLAGKPLKIRCDWCASDVDLEAIRPLLVRCLSGEPPVTHSSVPVPAPAPAAVMPPSVPLAPMAPPLVSGISSLNVTLLGLAGLGLVLVGFAGVGMVGYVIANPAIPKAQLPPVVEEPVALSGWEGGGSLAPAWTEQAYQVVGDQVLIVGSAKAATVEQAADQARLSAMVVAVERLERALKGTAVFDFLQQMEGTGEKNHSMVAESLLSKAADSGAPRRAETAVRHDPDGVFVFAQYAMPKAGWQALVEHYGRVQNFRGVQVAPVFPTLVPTMGGDGELLVVSTSRWVRDVNPGDLVVSVGGRGVFTLEDFDKQASGAWSRLSPGRSMAMEVQANGLRRSVYFRKPEPKTP